MYKTGLNEWHKANGEITDFAGWELSTRFSSISQEHMAVRESVGLFDISHMGRILVEGEGATSFLEHIATRDVEGLTEGRCGYTAVCNERGGTRDDLIFNRFSKDKYFVICNASNRIKILNWLKSLKNFSTAYFEDVSPESDKIPELKIEDRTFETMLLAIQGPKAEDALTKITEGGLPEKRYTFKKATVSGYESVISRTGYTGEDGFEIIPLTIPNKPSDEAVEFWESILEAGEEFDIEPCGLGSRDTLRLEAAMCLYGNDLTEEITPLEAGLNFVINLDKDREFIGKDALLKQKEEGLEKLRVGFEIEGSGIARHHMDIKKDGEKIGEVTSGTFSPVLEKGIGMGYIPPEYSDPGTGISIDVRGREVEAKIVEQPFIS